MLNFMWQGKPWQAFKTFAAIFSFIMNFILLLVLLIAAPIIIPVVDTIVKPLVGGLTDSFVEMGEATIVRTINVEDEIPIAFTLPLSATTSVRLTEAVPLVGIPATFLLPDGGGQINGTVALSLPPGLELPVALSLDVPVSQTVPVELSVEVSIPLDETELGAPFISLQGLFAPLDNLLDGLPSSNEELLDRVMVLQPQDPQPITSAPE